MIYAFCTDGLDFERREQFDAALVKGSGDEKAKAAREKDAVQALLNIPGVAGGR